MPKDYIPRTDEGLRSWAEHFGELISQNPTSFGLTAELAADYMNKLAEYHAALAAAQNPPTRGGSTIFATISGHRDPHSHLNQSYAQAQTPRPPRLSVELYRPAYCRS
jgi:hypothetical protein